jgi:pSer/pThr/pTyr-binding forkhead associated (FHA) protein
MSFQLVPLIKGTAPIIALHRPVLLIGRHIECDVRLDFPKISRRHCCVAIAYDRVLVRDLGSRNQVRVNGRVVEEARLQAGDELAIGPILYRLEAEVENRPGVASPARPASVRTTPKHGSSRAGVPAATPKASPAEADSDLDLIPLDDL